ncbi:MAG: T9SS type A sorting domain-containing protein, partial [Salinivirgaceae bacterium]|nr:T9SS type A sorting domain-containing protein [Salinivirgaceae bacterium]
INYINSNSYVGWFINRSSELRRAHHRRLCSQQGYAIKPQTDEEQTEKPNAEMLAENRLAIYPNPAGNEATISYHVTAKSDVVIQIWNTTGQQVYSETLNTKTAGMHHHTVATTTLPQGVYLVRLQVNSAEQATKRLIINR